MGFVLLRPPSTGILLSMALLLSTTPTPSSSLLARSSSPPSSSPSSPSSSPVAAEARCALSLLPRLLVVEGGVVTDLFVFGGAPWLGDLLALLPGAVTAVVTLVGNPERATAVGADRRLDGLRIKDGVLLFLGDGVARVGDVARRLNVHILARVLVWATAQGPEPTAEDVRLASGALHNLCHANVRLAVTDGPTGGATTHVYAVSSACGGNASHEVELDSVLDAWSPEGGWRNNGSGLFEPPCLPWRPTPTSDGEKQPLEFLVNLPSNWDQSRREVLLSLVRSVSRGRRHRDDDHHDDSEVAVDEHYDEEVTVRLGAPASFADYCRVDAVATILSLQQRVAHRAVTTFPWKINSVLIVVPAGTQPPDGSMMDQLTSEFQPGMWAATLASLLTMVAVLAVLAWGRRRRRGQRGGLIVVVVDVGEVAILAVSLALRPLMGQDVAVGRRVSQRSLLGSWMIVCVVVVAAYQGKLLARLSHEKLPGDIDSIEELIDESNLTVMFTAPTVADIFPWTRPLRAGGRLEFVGYAAFDASVRRIAERRDAAMLMTETFWESVHFSLRDSPRLHTFRINDSVPVTLYTTRRGSPFEVPLRRVLGYARAAGISPLEGTAIIGRSAPTYVDRAPVGLALGQVSAALAMLAGGHAVAATAFLAELCLRRAHQVALAAGAAAAAAAAPASDYWLD